MTDTMPARSLTQTEAEERARLLTVERYDVAVDLTGLPDGPEVRCVSGITFTCTEPGAATFVDCAAEVVSAVLNGAEVGPPVAGRIELRDLAEHNRLVIETVQSDTSQGPGVHRAVDPADREVYVWTSFEPDEAKHVWACFDQPDLKAPHRFVVTAPTDWRVCSNSGDPAVEDLGEARRWTFPDTPPLSTYNPVVLAGPFHELRREVGGFDLGILARRSLAAILERDAEELFTVTGQGLAFYGEQFGMPFPQRKYDQVFLPEFGGAMENYGCVAWSDTFLRRTTPTPAEQELLAKVLLHEMAHMWFGNIVTMRWWDDLWLNEAFAEFACNWAAVSATRYVDTWAGHLAEDEIDAYLADQGPISHPIRQPIRDVDEAASIFDAITYPKGASVLLQLQHYVGEDAFRRGMTAYFADHAWGNTTLQDLVDALAASGRDLDTWRRGWLETAGTDRLTLEQVDGTRVLRAEGPTGTGPRPHVTTVGAYRREGQAFARVASVPVEVAGPRTEVDLPEADLYLVNDQDLTFATTRPDAASRPVLLQEAAGLPTSIARGVAVATAWDMLANGEVSAEDVVGCLVEVAKAETAPSVVEPYLRKAADAAELWSPPDLRLPLMAEVAAVSRTLAARPERRQVALRMLARVGSRDDLAWIREVADSDVDLNWRRLIRAAELGGPTGEEVEHLLARDPDPDAWVRALTVRAATGTAEAKAELWERLVVHRDVPVGAAGLVANTFWRPGQEDLLAPYAERYLEALPSLHEGGMIPAMVLAHRLFPTVGVTAEFLDRAATVAASAAPVVRTSMMERADEVRRMLVTRGG